jgi:2-succinyl-5-enolpyruvyl-6-hydroxy-3-cyclohexene-1-carboxylate synthase
MTPENLLTEWARLLVESLADAGVRDVIVSPGSRSTPLVWAALACDRLTCRSIVDERDAAFFAVGRAKLTGVPSVVLCTSGSAAAEYFPAVVEASLSRTPLLVLTADRPFELVDCAAPQTLDQNRLFGEYVRRFVEVGMPDAEEAALVGLRRRITQAVFDTVGAEPGPVHVNVRMRKPLEPATGATPAGIALAARVTSLVARPFTTASRPERLPGAAALRDLAAACSTAQCGLVVCGPTNNVRQARGALLDRFCESTGFLVYAEATSQLRFAGLSSAGTLDALDVLLRSASFRRTFRPDLVLQIGDPPTSGAWERFAATLGDVPRHVVTAHGWPDPQGTARTVIVADVEAALAELVETVTHARGSRAAPAWLPNANAAAWRTVNALLAAETTLSEGAAVRAARKALPEGGLLAVGNSLPVRHIDAFCPADAASSATVWSQRGVSGIDGVVAGAAGAADANGTPAVLIIGDVSALHDLGGFAAAASLAVPFVVVILNNDGGRIFEQLPLADTGVSEERLRFWTTPHGATFDGLARLFRLAYVRTETLEALRAALDAGLARGGCTVIEVPLPPHGSKERYDALGVRIEDAIRAIVGPVLVT